MQTRTGKNYRKEKVSENVFISAIFKLNPNDSKFYIIIVYLKTSQDGEFFSAHLDSDAEQSLKKIETALVQPKYK